MKRFEYKTVKITAKGFWKTAFNREEIDRELNEYGGQGWELVSVQNIGHGGNSYEFHYTFKREK